MGPVIYITGNDFQHHQIALDPMDPGQSLLVDAEQDPLLELLQLVSLLLEDREVVVDGRVQERVQQVVGAGPAQHPAVLAQAIADRLVRYATVVGRENVMAGTDCGLGPRVGDPQIAWAKFDAMAEGARLATKELWGKNP